MANFYRLYNTAGLAYDFGDVTVFGLNFSSKLGIPRAERSFSQPYKRSKDPLSSISYGNRQAELMVQLRASSVNNLQAGLNTINRIIDGVERYNESQGSFGYKAWFVVSPNGYSSTPVQFEIQAAELQDDDVFQQAVQDVYIEPECKLILWLSPFGQEQQLASESLSINTGAETAVFFTDHGTRKAPARVTWKQDNNRELQRLIIGKRTRGNTRNFISVMECESGTFTGYTVTHLGVGFGANAVDANCHNGMKTGSWAGGAAAADLIKWTITSNLEDFYGTFKVYLRVAASQAYNLQLFYGGGDGKAIPNSPVSIANPTFSYTVFELGTIRIPHMAQFGRGVLTEYNFVLAQTTSVANALDCIYLVPADEEVMDLAFQSQLTGTTPVEVVSDDLDFSLLGYAMYNNGVQYPVPYTPRAHTGFSIDPGDVKPNLFIPLVLSKPSADSDAYVHSLTGTGSIKVEFQPHWDLLADV